MKKTSSILTLLITIMSTIVSYAQTDTLSMLPSDTKENWLYLKDGSKPQPIRRVELKTDVVVIGGGISGVSAAVSAARQGSNVILVQDRPVLGGNASSEIRMTMNGAHCERETGVMEELLIQNLAYNPQHSYTVWDHILYNYVVENDNITLLLNTTANEVVMNGDKIAAVECYQLSTESKIKINAPIFIDCTGDGFIGAKAGAEYRTGRESKSEFNETFAPEEADGWVWGETIMMSTKDMGRPVPFVAPEYAIPYKEHRKISTLAEGYWWIEVGSEFDAIADRHDIHKEVMAYFYGVWDHIKNSGKYPEAENLAIDWVGSLPGRRESRRLIGDYILSDGDMLSYKHFDDAVAYGGWGLDDHCEGGIESIDKPASYHHARFSKYYEIPFRCLYSRNIENLLMAGRCISATHVALSSTRIIGTCSTLGMATGVAAAMCSEKSVNPRDIYNDHIDELQERMLRQDYFIPNRPAEDKGNLIKSASKFKASSTKSGDIKNLLDGISRPVAELITHWESNGKKADIDIEWRKPVNISSVEFKFDTNLKETKIMMRKDPKRNAQQLQTVPPQLVKAFVIEAKIGDSWKEVANIENNIRRYCRVNIDPINTKALKIKITDTQGAESIKMFELRCY